ncbi:MAG: glycosyltransferase family 2 protein [Phycisphaerae bacterium]
MRVLVAVPVYNEERYLPRVLSAVRRHGHDVLVVNDGSTDGTARLLRAERELHTITHSTNRGYGQSLIDAFAFAAERRYDWVITIDCDEQHEPAQIPEFVRAARRNRTDVISGSRYRVAHPDDDEPPADRRQINRVVTDLLRQLLGLRLTDSFCGFKAHRVAALERLALDEPGYAFPLQFWVQCVRAGLRIEELPVHRVYRDETRQFGGRLNDPAARLQHYLEVLTAELRRPATRIAAPAPACGRSACE